MIGSETARLIGLKVGDTFRSVHGSSPKGRAHNHPFRVTGILRPVGGPYDTAIFIDMKDVWEAHEEREPDKREVTALLVVPKGYREAMQLLSAYRKIGTCRWSFPPSPSSPSMPWWGRRNISGNLPRLPSGGISPHHAPRYVLERPFPHEGTGPSGGPGSR